MKFKELKLMSDRDLDGKETELRKELMRINSQIATGTIQKNTNKPREIKRTIARLLTLKLSKKSGGGEKRNG